MKLPFFGNRSTNRKSASRPGSLKLGMETMEDRILFSLPDGLVAAPAAVVIDGHSGDVIGGLNEHTERAMASTTKIMTALVAIERSEPGNPYGLSLDDVVEIGAYPTGIGGSGPDMFQGEEVVLQDLLRIMMLPSGNEAAQAIAEHVALHDSATTQTQVSTGVFTGLSLNTTFTNIMNDRAEELGLENTHFVNPHGRDPEDFWEFLPNPFQVNDGHYSSALDLATLGRFAMQNPTFANIVDDANATVTSTLPDDTTRTFNLRNTNRLLARDPYPGAEGVKTGTTDQAGQVLVSQSTILGRTVTAVVMGADDRYTDSKALLNFGFETQHGFQVNIEEMSVRTQLADFTFDDGVLKISGDQNVADLDDEITLRITGDTIEVTLNGATEGFPFTDIEEIVVEAGQGDDSINLDGSVPESLVSIDGGSGSDVFTITTTGMIVEFTGNDQGLLSRPNSSDPLVTFAGFEEIKPDDHGDTITAATPIQVPSGCLCDASVSRSGVLGSSDDRDWFSLEVGTGTVTIEINALSPDDASANLQLYWLAEDNTAPQFLGNVEVGNEAFSAEVETGKLALRVSDSDGFAFYDISATVPQPPLDPWDLMPRFEKPELLHADLFDRIFDPIGPRIDQVLDSITRDSVNERIAVEGTVAVKSVDQVFAKFADSSERRSHVTKVTSSPVLAKDTAVSINMTLVPFKANDEPLGFSTTKAPSRFRS